MNRLIAPVVLPLLATLAAPVTAQPVYPGGAPTSAPVYCNRSLQGTQPAGTYEVVAAGTGGESIYVCGQNVTAAAPGTWQLKYGTGSACGTDTVNLTPAFNLSGQAPLASRSPVAGHFLPRSQALCVTVTGGPLAWVIFYSQF
jgi:hypothetical protein